MARRTPAAPDSPETLEAAPEAPAPSADPAAPVRRPEPEPRELEVGPGAAGTRHLDLGVLKLGDRHVVAWAPDGWRWLEPGTDPVQPAE